MNEWIWLKHPSRNNGEPIPVQVFTDCGVRYYRPFDTEACEFEMADMDSEWEIVDCAQEARTFEQWMSKQHGDPEEVCFLQALRIAYQAGQDSIALPSKPLKDELAVLRLVSEEYNAWIQAHAGGGSYDEFLKQRLAAYGIKEGA